MIIGIGVDSIEISRVAKATDGERLRVRLFTQQELDQVVPGPKGKSRMAALFAGKEAVLKAMGTGLAGHSWQDIEVLHAKSGAPYVLLHGKAQESAAKLGITKIHISLTHDQTKAMAFCVAEGGT